MIFLSSILLTKSIIEVIFHCNHTYRNGIQINDSTLNSLLLLGGQLLLPDAEDPQRAFSALHNNTEHFKVKVSPLKSKEMSLKGQIKIRCKIITGNTVMEQLNTY
jgi:hypothetical protein